MKTLPASLYVRMTILVIQWHLHTYSIISKILRNFLTWHLLGLLKLLTYCIKLPPTHKMAIKSLLDETPFDLATGGLPKRDFQLSLISVFLK